MSNRDFDDDFNFDDEFDSGSGDDLGDDLSPDFDGDSGDIPDLGDEPDDSGRSGGGGGGPSGVFIGIAAVMVILFLAGLAAVIFLATRETGPSELELTATAITIINSTTIAQQTETIIAIQIAEAATGTANAATDTPTPRPTVTPTFTPTDAPTLDPTLQAAFDLTQTAIALNPSTLGALLNEILRILDNMTPEQREQAAAQLEGAAGTVRPNDPASADLLEEAANALRDGDIEAARAAIEAAIESLASFAATQIALSATPTSEIDLAAVQQTATALAGVLVGVQPTVDIGVGGGGETQVVPTREGGSQLPNTGFIDDVVGGGRNGVGLVVLMGFGLVGVIFISRRLRTVNSK